MQPHFSRRCLTLEVQPALLHKHYQNNNTSSTVGATTVINMSYTACFDA
jgi:hypothetical protein